MPPSNTVLILLATVTGMVAVVAVVIAVTFATHVSALTNDNQATLRQISANRLATVTVLCGEIERLKGDLRAVLRRFHVERSSLPQHMDGSRALDPVGGGCARRARELVDPPPKHK